MATARLETVVDVREFDSLSDDFRGSHFAWSACRGIILIAEWNRINRGRYDSGANPMSYEIGGAF